MSTNAPTRLKLRRVAIIGAGHVGVVYAAGLAALGHHVTLVDVDAKRVAALAQGEVWFHEPELRQLLKRGIAGGRVRFTTSYKVGLRLASFAFVCVPTPTTSDGSLDDSFLRSAYGSIRANCARPAPIVVNKSTVSVGTENVAISMLGSAGIEVVANPEFLAEGSAVRDFFHPARIVIGARTARAAEAVASLYSGIDAPIIKTDPVTAELIKLAANAFLATKISFANAVARIAESVGADPRDIARGLSADRRIGTGHLNPGLGFGGSCLPKDLLAVENLARRYSASPELFGAVAAVNRAQRTRVVDFLLESFGSLADRRIAVLGAAFKPNTDDIRESPALGLAVQLAELHADVKVFDPAASARVRQAAVNVRIARSAASAAKGADALIVATDWPQFAKLEPRRLRETMRGSLVIDARGVIDVAGFREAGLQTYSLSSLRIAQHSSISEGPSVAAALD